MKLEFDDFEHYRAAAQGWGLEFVQLDKGPFRGALCQTGTDRIAITHFSLNRRFHQQGLLRSVGRTFALFLDHATPMKWQNSAFADLDYLVVFPADGALEALTSPGFDAVGISIEDDWLASVAEANELGHVIERLSAPGGTYRTDGRLTASIRRAVKQLVRFDGLNMPLFAQRELEHEIALHCLAAYSCALPNSDKSRVRMRDRAFRTALHLIHQSPDCLLSIPEVSASVGVSERTLRNAFQDRLGTSPKHYINARRLTCVRHRLASSKQQNETVQDIAAEFGYWHTGQFAADYRTMFGELPTETVLRHAGRRN